MNRAPNPIVATAVLSVAAIAIYAGIRFLPDNDPAESSAADVRSVPEFAMPDLDGNEVSMQSWPGRPLIVNFWATWCAPCLREIPLLKAYQLEHPDTQIVGIALDSDAAVQAFAETMEFNYPILVGPGGFEAAAAFGAEYVALPLTVFADADQRLFGIHMGELHAEQLENFTRANTGLASGQLDFSAARNLVAPQQ
jgi:thiol-disulfide isomerase/thioredoxin